MISLITHNCRVSEAMCPSTPNVDEEIRNAPYLNAIGSLMYAMLSIRLDISQAVGLFAWYSSDLGSEHWKCIKWIFQYFKGMKDYWLCYQCSNMKLQGYTNVDWGEGRDGHKSISSYIVCLVNFLII